MLIPEFLHLDILPRLQAGEDVNFTAMISMAMSYSADNIGTSTLAGQVRLDCLNAMDLVAIYFTPYGLLAIRCGFDPFIHQIHTE
jgi:hypothetical protein